MGWGVRVTLPFVGQWMVVSTCFFFSRAGWSTILRDFTYRMVVSSCFLSSLFPHLSLSPSLLSLYPLNSAYHWSVGLRGFVRAHSWVRGIAARLPPHPWARRLGPQTPADDPLL